MSKTGNGHQASAQALAEGFEQHFGNQVNVTIIDFLFDHIPYPLNLLPRSYNTIISNCPWVWQLVWNLSMMDWLRNLLQQMIHTVSVHSAQKMLTDYQPDLIVAVHAIFVQTLTIDALRKVDYHAPFVTVVTDLIDIHPLWFHSEADLCFVGSDSAYQRGCKAGISPQQLRQYGLPIRQAFTNAIASNESKSDLRQKLGLHRDLSTVLLLGGRTNQRTVLRIAQTLSKKLSAATPSKQTHTAQLVIICGQDTQLYAMLTARTWQIPTVIVGFVENMAEWMRASDCLVTKAGPGVIAEAMACGLPMILYGYVPGQEAGNVPFVVENNMGTYSEDAEEIANWVVGWFGPNTVQLKRMATQAKCHGRPEATSHIIEDIGKLIPDLKHRRDREHATNTHSHYRIG